MGLTGNVLVGDAEITLGVGIDARVIGYTVDGVTMTVGSSFFDAKVEENEGTIIRRLTDQEVKVSLNVAEATIANLAAAIPGCELTAANIVTIGGEDLQETRLTLRGTTVLGRDRVIVLTSVNPTGEVTTPYKKGEITVVPMVFSALVDDDGEFGSVLDAIAASPELDLPGTPPTTNGAGTQIIVTFDVAMAVSTDKENEFWFTRDGAAGELFTSAVTAGAVITLVPASAILHGEVILLYYTLGTVLSAAGGVLQSFADEPVTNIV
jgi:hypothetical protein